MTERWQHRRDDLLRQRQKSYHDITLWAWPRRVWKQVGALPRLRSRQEENCASIASAPARSTPSPHGGSAGFNQMMKHYEERAPLGRSCTLEELGAMGVFLASDGSASITGSGAVRRRRLSRSSGCDCIYEHFFRTETVFSRNRSGRLRPWVPARDFELSKKFYQALGFSHQEATKEAIPFASR